MFSTGRHVRLLRDLETKYAILKAGTCGHVTDQIESNLYKVQFEIPRKYDVKRFGKNLLLSVEVLADEIERV